MDIISGKDFGLRAKFAADQTEATEAIDNFQINAKGKGGSTLDEIGSQVMWIGLYDTEIFVVDTCEYKLFVGTSLSKLVLYHH